MIPTRPSSPARSAAAARARARAQHHQPLADFGRLHAAKSRDHRDHDRRAQGPRSAAGAAPQLLAVEPLRCDQAVGTRARRDRPVKILCDDQQCGEAARLRPGRCRALSTSCHGGIEAQVNSRICSARIISRPPTPTTTSPPARRGRSRRRWATVSSAPVLARALIRLRSRRNSSLPRAAVLFGNAQQEARVDRDPAFAAVGERDRRRRAPC